MQKWYAGLFAVAGFILGYSVRGYFASFNTKQNYENTKQAVQSTEVAIPKDLPHITTPTEELPTKIQPVKNEAEEQKQPKNFLPERIITLDDFIAHTEEFFGHNFYNRRNDICELVNNLLSQSFTTEKSDKYINKAFFTLKDGYSMVVSRWQNLPFAKSYQVKIKLPDNRLKANFSKGAQLIVAIGFGNENGSWEVEEVAVHNFVENQEFEQDTYLISNLSGIQYELDEKKQLSVKFVEGLKAGFTRNPDMAFDIAMPITKELALKLGLQAPTYIVDLQEVECYNDIADAIDSILGE